RTDRGNRLGRPALRPARVRQAGGEERGLMARRERYVVGLDVGTSPVGARVGESMDDGTLDIVGIGTAESRGIKRGVVVNVDAAVDSINKTIEKPAERRGV